MGFQFLEAVFTAIATSINIQEYSKNLLVGEDRGYCIHDQAVRGGKWAGWVINGLGV